MIRHSIVIKIEPTLKKKEQERFTRDATTERCFHLFALFKALRHQKNQFTSAISLDPYAVLHRLNRKDGTI